MPSKKVSFTSFAGHKLAGRLETPSSDQPIRAYGIFVHCFTCSKDYKAVYHICKLLAAQGIAMLRFDLTGLGESGGTFEDSNFHTNVEDVLAASGYLKTHYESPKLFIGLSLGGAAAIHAACKYPDIESVVTIATPSNLMDLGGRFEPIRSKIAAEGIAEVDIRGRKFKLKDHFFEALETTRMDDPFKDFGKPLLIIHSSSDEIVDICHAEELFALAERPKSLIMLEGVDHLISNDSDANYVASLISTWLSEQF